MARLFVGGLPWATTGEELSQLLSQAGTVTFAEIRYQPDGKSRGFGFVEMSDEDAQKAIEMFNGSEYGGRKLVVNEARPMTPRNDNGGGGRRHFGHRNRE